ncbi:Znhit2 [Symbiodinium natans]|uniref:Znhit2 protein n=1 Tax=Symbiodinium natans TaxID=878477 RepID=A0A812PQ22_9DINO|nr:Znhit2 [Symbiodinium natans]
MAGHGCRAATCACLLFSWNLVMILIPVPVLLDSISTGHTWDPRVLHNMSEAPLDCTRILLTDIVPNASIAGECQQWCHESIGPRSHIEYFLVAPFIGWTLATTRGAETFTIFMCWKVETASFGLWFWPSAGCAYMAAFVYGSASFMLLVYSWKDTPKELCSLGPKQDGLQQNGPFATGRCKAPLCCISVSSDREASEWDLCFSAVLLSLEPTLDALSIITFLRCGQIFYAALAMLGVTLASAERLDLLQTTGAKVMAQSLAQGFATRGLHDHKASELFESVVVTVIQCNALLRADPLESAPSFVINLLAGVSISLFITMPEQSRSWILTTYEEAPLFQDFYALERTKAKMNIVPRYVCSLMCVIAAAFWILASPGAWLALLTQEHEWTKPSGALLASCWSLVLFKMAVVLTTGLWCIVMCVGGLVMQICDCLSVCWPSAYAPLPPREAHLAVHNP